VKYTQDKVQALTEQAVQSFSVLMSTRKQKEERHAIFTYHPPMLSQIVWVKQGLTQPG
jgi:hypothetical protein